MTYTEREIDIISCLCNGGTTKSIERLLGISPNAINFYIKSIKEKMNCFSRESVIRFVEDSGEYEYINKKYAKLRGLSCSVAEIDNRQKTDKWQKFFGENVILKIGCLTSAFGVIITSIISFYLEELPLSYEIELPNKNILIQRENIMNQIKKGFDSNEEIKFVVLVGESGIGKTTIARKYIKEHDFSLKAEIDAESEFKIVKSLEYLVFRLSKTEDQLRIMQVIRNIKDLDEKGQKLKILLAELLKNIKVGASYTIMRRIWSY